MKEPEYLYHYTNFKGLKGIVDSKSLRFSDYRSLTDRSEFIYSRELLCEVIKDVFPFLQTIGEEERKEKAALIWDIFVKDKHPKTYLLCLCEHEESDQRANGLLSMWRSYGQNGGYSLVFDKTKLIEYLREQAAHCLKALLLDDKVEYPLNEAALLENLKAHLTIFSNFMKEEVSKKIINNSYELKGVGKFLESMLHLVTLIKHPGFREENEYRFCLFAQPEELLPESEKHFAFKSQIEEFGSSVVSYIERPIELENLLKEIIIGPQQDIKTKKEFLEGYLRSQGLAHIIVRTSEIPYLPR